MLKDIFGEKKTAITQQELDRMLRAHELYVAQRGGLRAQLAHKNLDGLILANRNLEEADFSGASLVGASLYGSNLHRAILYCADLRNCDLRMTKLIRADLRGASFKGARLGNAELDNADLRSGMMMYMGATDVSLAGHSADPDSRGSENGVDFSNCSLKGASFGNAKLDGANFTGAMLQGATFRNANLTNVVFKNAVLTGVNLSELQVPREALEGCVKDVSPEAMAKAGDLKARIEAHQKWIATQGREGALAVLDGEDLRPLQKFLSGHRLPGLSARRVIAIGLDLSDSQLQAAKCEGADFRGANFAKADLRGVSFKNAQLTHAIFDGADIRSLEMAGGTKLSPDLAGAQVTEVQLQNAVCDKDD